MIVPNVVRTAEDDAIIAASRPVIVHSREQSGKVGWALLWLLGIPLPVLLVAYLIFHH